MQHIDFTTGSKTFYNDCLSRVESLNPQLETVKVSLSRNEILLFSILPKNELENVNFCPSLLGQKFFVRFLGELKKTKSLFENNWP